MSQATAREGEFWVPGRVFDGYRLVCQLGEGGMGEVWLAELDGRTGIQKLVALKTISPRISDDARFRLQFLDEARVAARISHPNVVPILGMGEASGRPYYAMEWVDGEPLRSLQKTCELAGHAMPPAIAARIVADVCLGLHAAHELRDLDGVPLHVVYRDVSPQNILLTEDGVPRVVDFGVAKTRARLTESTSPGMLVGKVAYMSPEQITMAPVDRRSDVWGAGAVLYELIVGHPIFAQDVALEKLGARERPAPMPPDVPEPIAAVVARALEPNPDDRFATALEMSLALEQALRVSGLSTVQRDVAEFAARLLAPERRARREDVSFALAEVRRTTIASPGDWDVATSSDSGSALPQRKTPSKGLLHAFAPGSSSPWPPWLWRAALGELLIASVVVAWQAGTRLGASRSHAAAVAVSAASVKYGAVVPAAPVALPRPSSSAAPPNLAPPTPAPMSAAPLTASSPTDSFPPRAPAVPKAQKVTQRPTGAHGKQGPAAGAVNDDDIPTTR